MTIRKPTHPVKVSSQKCFKCMVVLKHGAQAIAHTINPVVWCIPCAGHLEPSRDTMCKAVIFDPDSEVPGGE